MAIGLVDSGVGGLTVLREIRARLPQADLYYLGDTARFPYGTKTMEQVEGYLLEGLDYLSAFGLTEAVVACNTATAAGLEAARKRYSVPILGVIEAGARPAVEASRRGRIGVVATAATVACGAYAKAIKERSPEGMVLQKSGQELVIAVENGETARWPSLVRELTHSLVAEGIDALVLGSTHLAVVKDIFREILGSGVSVIDPAEETAMEVLHLGGPQGIGRTHFYVTGDPGDFSRAARAVYQVPDDPGVEKVILPGRK